MFTKVTVIYTSPEVNPLKVDLYVSYIIFRYLHRFICDYLCLCVLASQFIYINMLRNTEKCLFTVDLSFISDLIVRGEASELKQV